LNLEGAAVHTRSQLRAVQCIHQGNDNILTTGSTRLLYLELLTPDTVCQSEKWVLS